MSLYADYLREKTDDLILETEQGFATYRYLNEGKSVYIIDIYVIPESRQVGIGSYMSDLVVKEARSKGCSELLGSVVTRSPKSSEGLKAFLGYGMELFYSTSEAIVLRKDI